MTSIPEPAQRPANDSTQAAVTTRGRVAPKRAKQANAIAGGKRRPRSAIRPGTKTAKILRLLKRPGGASLAELTKATGWQAHSVRGFLRCVSRLFQPSARMESELIAFPPNVKKPPGSHLDRTASVPYLCFHSTCQLKHADAAGSLSAFSTYRERECVNWREGSFVRAPE